MYVVCFELESIKQWKSTLKSTWKRSCHVRMWQKYGNGL